MKKILESLRVPSDTKIDLRHDYDPGFVGHFMSKEDVEETTAADIQLLAQQQDKLYAQNTYALLIILQALDAAGKDVLSSMSCRGSTPRACR